MFIDYIASAPAAETYMEGITYRKMHYGWTDTSRAGGDEPTHQNFLDKGLTVVSANAPEYTPRPAAFHCANFGSKQGSFEKGGCEEVGDLTLYAYPNDAHTGDARVAYSNPTYPWILALHKFTAIKPTEDKNGFPKQFDTARFDIPAGSAAGGYIVQYYWRGYRDCIDVDVLPATTPVPQLSRSMYGGFGYDDSGETGGGGGGGGGGETGPSPPPLEYMMLKTDHCQYTAGMYTLDESATSTCHPIPPPAATNSQGETREAALEACMTRCEAADGCEALNLVPARPPPSAIFGGAARNSLPSSSTGCTEADLAAEPAGTSVCFGLVPIEIDPDIATEPFLVVSDDPEDEIYFSTCFKKKVVLPPFGGAPPPPALAPSPAPWAVGDRCLSCADTQTSPVTSYWQLAAKCEMCTRDVGPGATLPVPPPSQPGLPTLLPPGSPPPEPASVTFSFAVGGAAADIDAGTQQGLGNIIAAHAGVAVSAVDLYITEDITAVVITASIAFPDLAAADRTAAALRAGIFASTGALQSTLTADGLGQVEVLDITSAPSAATLPSDGSGSAGVVVVAAVSVAAAVVCLAACVYLRARRRRQRAEQQTGTKGKQGRKYSQCGAAGAVELSGTAASRPPPPPPPSANLPEGWTEHSEGGQRFYYNSATGESAWERPTAECGPAYPVD